MPPTDDVKKVVQDLESVVSKLGIQEGPEIDSGVLSKIAGEAPVVRLIDMILKQAVTERASDVHIEPFEDEVKIRYRVDGVLADLATTSRRLSLALTSRIKVMADLDIAERRLPQDGRISASVEGRAIDLRVSTLPTVFGEGVVLRVLDKRMIQLTLEDLGFHEDILKTLLNLIRKPHGLFLLTGPTGCGKTTTLYACLRLINAPLVKIITVEDPVEYDVAGIVQMAVHPKIDLTFPRCLRAILRQDPDILMVGEIRDQETAEIAMQASLTGHFVFSTLHTNDAAGAVTRLIDVGVEPYLIVSSLKAVLAQRLVRTLCKECRVEAAPSPEMLSLAGLGKEEIQGKKFYQGKGCKSCFGSGYAGRAAIGELLLLDEEIRSLALRRTPVNILKEKAVLRGMRPLRQDGLMKVYNGVTTLEEVLRETYGA